jgi:hypothetical protein
VQAVEAAILNLSENPQALQAHIATLPEAIQLKATDVMRLSTAYGPPGQGGGAKFEQFINSLSPSEYQTFELGGENLVAGTRMAILVRVSL